MSIFSEGFFLATFSENRPRLISKRHRATKNYFGGNRQRSVNNEIVLRRKEGTYPAPVLVLAAVAAEDAAEAADAAELAAADAAAPCRCSQFMT